MTLSLGAFAAGTLSADDVDLGAIAANKTVKGFTFVPSKGLSNEDKSKEPININGKTFTRRLKASGADDYISFQAKKGEKVSAIVCSGSKDSDRQVVVKNAKNKKLSLAVAPKWNMAAPKGSEFSFEVPEDGEYRICGAGGGIYIFEIEVK